MLKKNLELWLAFLVIILITSGYLWYVLQAEVPAASGFFGHALGVIGFILMLMTEILYSLRKRSKSARWGKLQHWLSFHIFTGLVGPFMVLLHTSWKFNGLAGILTLFTLIIVLSGFVGRYFYTAVPRDLDGSILEIEGINKMLNSIQIQLAKLLDTETPIHDQLTELLNYQPPSLNKIITASKSWRKLEKDHPQENQQLIRNIQTLWERQQTLRLELGSVADRRRLLALWHTFHIPLGIATFCVAFIHIAAALYYATFLH
jgi:hypothetical protein